MYSVTISLGLNCFIGLDETDNCLYVFQQGDRGQVISKVYLCEATKGAASAVQDYIERMKTFLA